MRQRPGKEAKKCSAENPVVGMGACCHPRAVSACGKAPLKHLSNNTRSRVRLERDGSTWRHWKQGDQQRRHCGQDHEKNDRTRGQGLGYPPSELLGVAREGVQAHSICAAPPVQAQIGSFNKESSKKIYESNF